VLSKQASREPWFSIVLEAKMRAMVFMVKKEHPDWNEDFIREALINLLNKSIEAELHE